MDDLHGIGDRPEAIVGAGLSPRPPGDAARARRARRPARALRPLPRPRRSRQGSRRAGAGPRRLPARRAGGSASCWPAAPPWRCGCPPGSAPPGFVDARTRADLLDASRAGGAALARTRASRSSPWRPGRRAGRRSPPAAPTCWPGRRPAPAAGLLYLDAPTYARQLTRLAADPPSAPASAPRRPHGWVADHSWDACARRWRGLLARVRAPARARLASGVVTAPVRCQERRVAHATTSPANRPAGSIRRATWRGVGRVPSNQRSVATRIVAESIDGRSKWPISSRMKPAVDGPIAGQRQQRGVDALLVAGGRVGLDVGERPVDRRPRGRQRAPGPGSPPAPPRAAVLARAQQVGGAREGLVVAELGDPVDRVHRLAPGGVGAADALDDVLEERRAREHPPAAVGGQVARQRRGRPPRPPPRTPRGRRRAAASAVRASAPASRSAADSDREGAHAHAAVARAHHEGERAAPEVLGAVQQLAGAGPR